jgi:hypothetical protein
MGFQTGPSGRKNKSRQRSCMCAGPTAGAYQRGPAVLEREDRERERAVAAELLCELEREGREPFYKRGSRETGICVQAERDKESIGTDRDCSSASSLLLHPPWQAGLSSPRRRSSSPSSCRQSPLHRRPPRRRPPATVSQLLHTAHNTNKDSSSFWLNVLLKF